MNSGKFIRILIAILCVISISGCKEKPSQSSNDLIIDTKTEGNTKLIEYKETGIQAIKEDRLTDGIKLVLKAIAIQDEPELHNILDDAYYERAEYFYSVGEKDKALKDLINIKNKDDTSSSLFYTIVSKSENIEIENPKQAAKIKDLSFDINWNICSGANGYEIHIEDSNWNTVILETVEENQFKIIDQLKDMSIYYCSIRANYPQGIKSVWSKKIWFEIQTLEGLKQRKIDNFKKIIRIDNYYTCTPNCVGGVDFKIIFTNLSPKTIKYAHFKVVPYNAVGDIVSCSIKNDDVAYISVTGPIKQWSTHGYNWVWETVWYNSTITRSDLIEIEIEYMDGSEITIDKEYIPYVTK